MANTLFAYHLTHVFGSFELESYHTNSGNPQEGDLVYVLSGNKDHELQGVDYYLEGAFQIHRKHPGPWKLPNLKGEDKDYQYRLSMVPVRRPESPIPLSAEKWYSRSDVHRFFSSGQNFNPIPPEYKSRFDLLLTAHGSAEADELLADLERLDQDVPDETERKVLAKARVGQGRFRADVVEAWGKGEACTLTGLSIPEMLNASHIKPWRESSNSERLDPMNGLLLIAHADRLFDRYLMSFQIKQGTFHSVLHPRIRGSLSSMGIREGMTLNTSHLTPSNERRFRQYMAEHLRRHQNLIARDNPST